MSPEPGQLVASKYRLSRPLASGGMGAVWVARHVELDVDVAVKFMHWADDAEPNSQERFRREARATAQLKSPHIVHIYDYGVDQDTPYITMELLDGEDMACVLEERHTLPLELGIDWIQQAGRGLRVVHEAGFVHRDIKPSNLFVTGRAEPRLIRILDFGLAKARRDDTDATASGLILGSPAYMSPEQARGKLVDQRSDLWSLAAVLYRMLTGVPPFSGHNTADLLVQLCTEEVRAPSLVAPWTSPWLERHGEKIDEFFRRALHPDPERRFASLDEFLSALDELTQGETRPSPAVPQPSSPPLEASSGRDSVTGPIPLRGDPGGAKAPTESARPAPAPHEVTGFGLLRYKFTGLALLTLLVSLALFWWRREEPAAQEVSAPTAPAPRATEPGEGDRSPEPQAQAHSASSAHDAPVVESAARTAPRSPLPAAPASSAPKRSPPPPPTRPRRDSPASSSAVVDPVFGLPVTENP